MVKLNNNKDPADGVTYIDGCVNHKFYRDVYLEIEEVAPGNYAIFVEMDWDQSATEHLPELSYCISSYGIHNVLFSEEDYSGSYSKEFILEKALTSKALSGKFDEDFNIQYVNEH